MQLQPCYTNPLSKFELFSPFSYVSQILSGAIILFFSHRSFGFKNLKIILLIYILLLILFYLIY